MAVSKPDIYQHNNPNNAFVDSTFVRGGGRVVPTLTGSTGLYGLTGKTDQLSEHITKVWVESESKNYILTDMVNVGNVSGWTIDTVDLSNYSQTGHTHNQYLNLSGGTLAGNLIVVITGATIDSTKSLEITTTKITGGTSTVATGLNNTIIYSGSPTISGLYGLNMVTTNSNSGTVSNLYGLQSYARNDGSGAATNLIGSYSSARNYTTGSFNKMIGAQSNVTNTSPNVSNNDLYGMSSTSTNNAGAFTDSLIGLSLHQVNIGTVNQLTGVGVYFPTIGTVNTELKGISLGSDEHPWVGSTANMYGIFIHNSVNSGTTNNYAIYSDTLAKSYLKGNLGIGIVPITTHMLQVNGTAMFSGDIIVNETSIGKGAGNSDTNLVIGKNALVVNTSGTWSVAIGSGALKAATSGNNNLAVGGGALNALTTGTWNVALGTSSMSLGLAPSYNTAIGASALSKSEGANNTGIGVSAGTNITTGASNLGIGRSSLFDLTTGSFNTAIGLSSLGGITTQSNNIAIGPYAARYMTNDSTSVTDLVDCIYIGYRAYPSAVSGVINEIAIGKQVQGKGSNTVTLGNDSVTNTYLKGAVNLRLAYIGKTTTYQILTTDSIVECTENSFTVTLPTAIGNAGREISIDNSGAGTITIATLLSQTINGESTITITQDQCVTLYSNGTNWRRKI